MLLYAVAWLPWVRGDSAGCPREIARHSGKQCSIGFQPVFCSHRRAMLFQTIDSGAGRPLPADIIVYNDQVFNQGLKPWAKFFSPFGAIKHPRSALSVAASNAGTSGLPFNRKSFRV